MRKSIKKILVTTLAVTLLVPSISVSAYTFNKKVDSDVYEVSDIKNLQMIKDGATTDIKMLNDIVERAYNNNFQNKNYIIKNQSEDLGRWDSDGYDLWGNYVLSRGDTYIATTFTEKAVVRDGKDYYHSVSVTSKPAWDSGATMSNGFQCINAFDRESRSIVKDCWDKYMKGIEDAEKEIGFTEGNDLCDFQLISQTYIWIKDNIHETSNSNTYRTGGQTAIECMLDKSAACAGQSRLFNRFMHDFGIDSYWINDPSIAHAWNVVKLSKKLNDGTNFSVYGGLDCQGTNYEKSTTSSSVYYYNVFSTISQDTLDYFKTEISVGKSILSFDEEFVKGFSKSEEDLNIDNISFGTNLPLFVEDKTNKGIFIQDADCPYCSQFGSIVHHSFTTGKLSTEKNGVDIKKENDKNIIENAGFEVYNNRFNYNTGGYDNFLKIEQGTRTEYETNTTTATPTTTEEPTSGDSEVTKETTAPDVEVPTTTKSEVEVPTPPTRPIETTTPEEETPSIVVPTKPVETTKKVEVPVTTPKQTTATQKETTTKVKTPKKAKISLKKAKKNSLKVKLTSTNAVKFKIQIISKSDYNKKRKGKKLKWTKAKTIKNVTVNKRGYFTITGLKKNTKYYIRVKGVNFKNVASKKWSTTLKKSTTKK